MEIYRKNVSNDAVINVCTNKCTEHLFIFNFQTTEILDLRTLSWSAGPPVPGETQIIGEDSTAAKFANTVLVMSAYFIHEYDVENNSWSLRQEHLRMGEVTGVMDISHVLTKVP